MPKTITIPEKEVYFGSGVSGTPQAVGAHTSLQVVTDEGMTYTTSAYGKLGVMAQQGDEHNNNLNLTTGFIVTKQFSNSLFTEVGAEATGTLGHSYNQKIDNLDMDLTAIPYVRHDNDGNVTNVGLKLTPLLTNENEKTDLQSFGQLTCNAYIGAGYEFPSGATIGIRGTAKKEIFNQRNTAFNAELRYQSPEINIFDSSINIGAVVGYQYNKTNTTNTLQNKTYPYVGVTCTF